MSDGRIHAVQVWCGPPDTEPPERPIPGPLLWDLTAGEATGTVQYLINAGMDPATEPTEGRTFIDDVPSRSAPGADSSAPDAPATPSPRAGTGARA